MKAHHLNAMLAIIFFDGREWEGNSSVVAQTARCTSNQSRVLLGLILPVVVLILRAEFPGKILSRSAMCFIFGCFKFSYFIYSLYV